MNTENVKQDGRKETLIYLPDDGRNFGRQNAMKSTTKHNLFME